MKLIAPHPQFSNGKEELNPVFSVVIAYENSLVGSQAMRVYELLANQFAKEFQFRASIWSFAALHHKEFSHIAAQEAVGAKLIIVTAKCSITLPIAVEAWIQNWLPDKRGQTAALISLLDCSMKPRDFVPPANSFLQQAAASVGLDFMAGRLQGLEQGGDKAPVSIQSEMHHGKTFHRTTCEGWGINE